MNDHLKKEMIDGWDRWHGNDIDTPAISPAFQRGFIVACESLIPLLKQSILYVEATAKADHHLTSGVTEHRENRHDKLVDAIRIYLA